MNVDKRFLILETNYKVYAYTCRFHAWSTLTVANELEIAILNLFIEIRVRYPNMVIGRLARDNVKKAMDNGITASQVSIGTARSQLTTDHQLPDLTRSCSNARGSKSTTQRI
jgi:hypothetical protein